MTVAQRHDIDVHMNISRVGGKMVWAGEQGSAAHVGCIGIVVGQRMPHALPAWHASVNAVVAEHAVGFELQAEVRVVGPRRPTCHLVGDAKFKRCVSVPFSKCPCTCTYCVSHVDARNL